MTSNCPVCDASVALSSDVAESELITCPECKSMLVVESVSQSEAKLAQAPQIEEDWGQ